MNVRRLRQVVKHIAAEPKRFDMGVFADCEVVGADAPKCGTVGCIAGWAVMLSGGSADEANDRTGAAALGLDYIQAARLFFTSGWPTEFSRRYYSAKTRRGEVNVAIARIEHFIKTKGAE